MKIASQDMNPQEVAHETEGGCVPINSGNIRVRQEPESSGEMNSEESTHQWKLDLAREIERPIEVPPSLREVNTRLLQIWINYEMNREALIENIDRVIKTFLYGAIEKDKNDERTKKAKLQSKGRKKPQYPEKS